MGAICNGVAYDGIFRVSGATFLVFADYMRGSVRLAALAKLPVTYIFTTTPSVLERTAFHQPVETVGGLRVIRIRRDPPGDQKKLPAHSCRNRANRWPNRTHPHSPRHPAQDSLSAAERRKARLRWLHCQEER